MLGIIVGLLLWMQLVLLLVGRDSKNDGGRKVKAILVVDMPKNCAECKLMYLQGIGESLCNAVDLEERPSWCPLRPLPSFKAVDLNDTRDVVMFCHGWNACLAEITGETE